MNNVVTKKCTGTCGEIKEVNILNFEFRNDNQTWRGVCRKCRNTKDRNLRDENKEEIIKKEQEYYETHKEQLTLYKANYYQEHKEEHAIQGKQYRKDNKEQLREYSKEYRSRPEVKQRRNEQERQRRESDPVYKLRCNVSKSICEFLKSNNNRKNGSILEYLDYTIEELKQHLEDQFEWWMSWENYGKYNLNTWNDNDPNTWTWNLDHIKAHVKFNYDSMEHPDFRKCWALDNLRPYSAKDNVIDGARRTRHKKKN